MEMCCVAASHSAEYSDERNTKFCVLFQTALKKILYCISFYSPCQSDKVIVRVYKLVCRFIEVYIKLIYISHV